MSDQIEKLIHEWRSSVSDYAKARAESVYLTEYRKSLKAIKMAKAQERFYDGNSQALHHCR